MRPETPAPLLEVQGAVKHFHIRPGGGRPGGTLVFDVELLSIKAAPKPPAVPEDVAE